MDIVPILISNVQAIAAEYMTMAHPRLTRYLVLQTPHKFIRKALALSMNSAAFLASSAHGMVQMNRMYEPCADLEDKNRTSETQAMQF